MENPAIPIELLFEIGEAKGKTSIELAKLKLPETTTMHKQSTPAQIKTERPGPVKL
jgi:hypothetical protein